MATLIQSVGSALLLALLGAPAHSSYAQTAPLSSSELLRGLPPASLTPAAASASCPLRPERVGVLKVGLAASQSWTRQTGLTLPVSLGYERRLFFGLSVLATFTSVYDPARQPLPGQPEAPGLTQFDVTSGLRYYLPIKGLRNEAREEFSGPYVSLLASRTFQSTLQPEVSGGAAYTYQLRRANQLVAGYQLPLGQRGFLDASAGLKLGRGSQAGHKLAPAAGLTVGIFF
ncbi:hypothetical protein [Hymenobacter jeollabukensis]|uniref:DUF3575 domain-containing protein n=1 Tax=Hymenobacter jeollabukensis TaxID=2025313 RepID=A0A5R8WU88_9BACT|nr:hypothetical protein [Hymenobacter jeollabukensis]TLM95331.1 hypothetical protein FDY95_05960 [Hymenobacter jeollabukensis]